MVVHRTYRQFLFLAIVGILLLLLSLYFSYGKGNPDRSGTYYDACVQGETSDKPSCFKRAINSITATGDPLDVLHFFARVATSETRDCHDLAHEAGKLIYRLQKNDLSKVVDGTSIHVLNYCAYGFWHGFVTSYARDTQSDIRKIGYFCEHSASKYGREHDCFHGFGLGAVGDPPPVSVWGNPDEMTIAPLANCQKITSNDSYREDCYQGVFHQLFEYMNQSAFGLVPIRQENPFDICNKTHAQYRHACLLQNIPSIYERSGSNMKNIKHALAEINDLPYATEMIKTAIMGATNITPDEELEALLMECREVTTGVLCMEGIVAGMLMKGDKAVWLKEANHFCKNALGNEEKKTCYGNVAADASDFLSFEKMQDFCASWSEYGDICFNQLKQPQQNVQTD